MNLFSLTNTNEEQKPSDQEHDSLESFANNTNAVAQENFQLSPLAPEHTTEEKSTSGLISSNMTLASLSGSIEDEKYQFVEIPKQWDSTERPKLVHDLDEVFHGLDGRGYVMSDDVKALVTSTKQRHALLALTELEKSTLAAELKFNQMYASERLEYIPKSQEQLDAEKHFVQTFDVAIAPDGTRHSTKELLYGDPNADYVRKFEPDPYAEDKQKKFIKGWLDNAAGKGLNGLSRTQEKKKSRTKYKKPKIKASPLLTKLIGGVK